MVYGPQRRHAVASLATGIQTLGLVQHLLTPNILILAARLLAQVQIVGAAAIHPSRSLFSMFIMVTLLNMAAVLLHMLDFAGGMNGGKGMMLDFVGQVHQASSTRILLIDWGLYILQLVSLVVSYVNHHAHSNPDDIKTSSLPYDDLLLPDSPSPEAEEPEADLESGLRKRRKSVPGVEDEIWLDEEEGDEADQELSDRKRLLSSTSSTPSSGRRIREPPLVFSLTLPHLLALIFYLPSPPEPRPAFAGGTPSTSPGPAPASARTLPNVAAAQAILADFHAGRSPAGGVPTTATTQQSSEPRTEDNDGDDESGAVSQAPDNDSERSGSRRIPGDYWVESNRGRGNGG